LGKKYRCFGGHGYLLALNAAAKRLEKEDKTLTRIKNRYIGELYMYMRFY